jgi:hypothetical protein
MAHSSPLLRHLHRASKASFLYDAMSLFIELAMKIPTKKMYERMLCACTSLTAVCMLLEMHFLDQVKYIIWTKQIRRHCLRTIIWHELGVWINVYQRISDNMQSDLKKSAFRKPLRQWQPFQRPK